MLRDLLDDGKTALTFLTCLPVGDRRRDGGDLAASAPMFPVIGALVGLAGALVYGIAHWLGLPPLPAAVCTLAAIIAPTCGLHEDGLADLADGLGGRTREERLRIMRESQIGSFGAMALTLALLARASALAALAAPLVVAAALISAGAVSRALVPVLMAALPLARAEGLAADAGRPHPARVLAGLALALLIALLLASPEVALAGSIGATVGALAVATAAQRWLGGITGDVLGAAQQLAEIGFLLAVLIGVGG